MNSNPNDPVVRIGQGDYVREIHPSQPSSAADAPVQARAFATMLASFAEHLDPPGRQTVRRLRSSPSDGSSTSSDSSSNGASKATMNRLDGRIRRWREPAPADPTATT